MAITESSREVRVLLVRGDGAAPEREREWEGLAGGLAREGLRVLTAAGADEALRRYRAEAPDAVVLDADADAGADVGGGLDALALCRAVRERAGPGGAAVVVLGRRIDDAPVAAAYAAGADAHVALPCAPRVLALRLRALVGSGAPGSHGSPGAPSPRPDPVLRLGGWELDPGTLEVRGTGAGPGAGGNLGPALTPAEFRLLYLLAANAGRTVSDERLREYAGVARVRAHLSRLRGKLGLPSAGAGGIEATDGLGYRYTPPPRREKSSRPRSRAA